MGGEFGSRLQLPCMLMYVTKVNGRTGRELHQHLLSERIHRLAC